MGWCNRRKVLGVQGKSVVYVNAIPGKNFPAPAKKPAIMNQKHIEFVPHVLVVQQGKTVEFLNSDDVEHNVFWMAINGDKKLGHNLDTFPEDQMRSWKFAHPGVREVLCNIHPLMSAYIVVSPTPYYAVTDATGSYSIQGIPDGNYTLTIWHEGSSPKSRPVKVAGTTKLDLQ